MIDTPPQHEGSVRTLSAASLAVLKSRYPRRALELTPPPPFPPLPPQISRPSCRYQESSYHLALCISVMPDSYQIFDVFVGVFSLLTVVPFVVTYLNWFLPRAQMRELQETFHDTQSHLYKNIEDGLLGQHLNVAGFQHRLDLYDVHHLRCCRSRSSLHHCRLKSRTEDIDADTRRAITYPQNLIKMLSGLSRRIYVLCGEVKALRADILVCVYLAMTVARSS